MMTFVFMVNKHNLYCSKAGKYSFTYDDVFFMVNKHNLYCSKAGKHSFIYDDVCLYGE